MSKNKPNINNLLRLVVVVLASIAAIILLWYPEGKQFQGGGVFFTFDAFKRVILVNLFWIIVLAFMPRLVVFLDVFLFIQVFFLGFFSAQVIYKIYPPQISWFSFFPDWAQSYMASHGTVRAYLFIPVIFFLVFYLTYPPGRFRSLLSVGNFSKMTKLLGKPMTWGAVAKRFLLYLGGFLLLFLVIRAVSNQGFAFSGAFSAWDGISRLIAIAVYAGIVALCEETIYRGIFLSVLADSFKPAIAIIIQAILFSIIHYMPGQPVYISAGALLIYGFLGWILGKAAWETGGLGAGFLIHFSIITSLALLGA
ncbi:MAG: CPBP family intramembrane metalloprotease [Chloroflexi bacterium]|nr:CPBP family intramembrane metalloprotease [Chloroflexota bacterium]